MICKNCNSDNIKIETRTIGTKSETHHTSFIRKLCRTTMQLFTLGFWGVLFRKKKESTVTKMVTQKMAVCQKCGNEWEL